MMRHTRGRWSVLLLGSVLVLIQAGCSSPADGTEPGSRPAAVASPTAEEPEPPPSVIPPLISLGEHEPSPAPDFTLQDQFGEPLTLSRLQGRTVLLTFLYTHCMTTCPLYGAWIHEALSTVDDQRDQVAVVAVTVDPERDTVDRLRHYTTDRGWEDNWFFVTGDPAAVEDVLASYRIAAFPREASPEMEAMGMEGYEVVHRAAVLLIDRNGYVVDALRNQEWTPKELSDAIRALP